MTSLGELFGPPSDALSTGLGVAAIVLMAGWALTRWQRDRLRFALMKTALEKGLTRFPGTPPYWLLSLRQGVTLLSLGAALGIVGSGAWWLAHGVEMPANVQTEPSQQSRTGPPGQNLQNPPGPPSSRFEHDDPEHQGPPRRPGPPSGREDDGFGPPHPPGPPPARPEDPLGLGPRDHQGPVGQGEREHGRQPRPEPIDPARERWHRAEAQQTIGLVTVGAGLILVMLGIVRICFAKVERRFAGESDEPGLY
jgi:hypothetical protein